MSKSHYSNADACQTIDFDYEQDAIFCNSGTTSSFTGSSSEDSDTKHVNSRYLNRNKRSNAILHRILRRKSLHSNISFNRKLHHDRNEGMALLSQVCFNTTEQGDEDVVEADIGSSIEEIDWNLLVKRAENLHAIEQNNLRKRRNRMSAMFPLLTTKNRADESKKRRRTIVDGSSDASTSMLSGISINLLLRRHAGKQDIGQFADEKSRKELGPETSEKWITREYEPYLSGGSEDSFDSRTTDRLPTDFPFSTENG
jgi:hypothetical protein